MEIVRGAVVVIAAKGAYTAKPRRAVVVQADPFNDTHASITLCPITTDCVDAPLFRITLAPAVQNGLSAVSQVMVDKVVSVPRQSVAREIGRCDPTLLEQIDDGLRLWLGL